MLLENTAEVTKIGISYHVGYLIYVIGVVVFSNSLAFWIRRSVRRSVKIFAGCLFDQSADI